MPFYPGNWIKLNIIHPSFSLSKIKLNLSGISRQYFRHQNIKEVVDNILIEGDYRNAYKLIWNRKDWSCTNIFLLKFCNYRFYFALIENFNPQPCYWVKCVRMHPGNLDLKQDRIDSNQINGYYYEGIQKEFARMESHFLLDALKG